MFLHRTSILDRLCAPLCDAVTGRADSKAVLALLEQGNMFLIRLDEYREWYRYHQLFADFLRNALSAAEERELHRKASAWYEAQGFGAEAIKHALAAKDIEASVRLVRGQVEDTLSRGEVPILLSWLAAIPESTLRSHSDLTGYKAWLLYLRGQSAEAQAYSPLARAFEESGASPEHLGMLLTFRAFLALNWADPKEAVPLAQQALNRFGDSASFFQTFALNLLGQAQGLTHDRPLAVETLRKAVERGRQLGNHLITLDALGHLAAVLNAQGRVREAILLCRNAAEQHVDPGDKPLPITGLVHVPLGTLYYEIDDLESARRSASICANSLGWFISGCWAGARSRNSSTCAASGTWRGLRSQPRGSFRTGQKAPAASVWWRSRPQSFNCARAMSTPRRGHWRARESCSVRLSNKNP
jgi:LuxR family transcriptional regulator, maltose regulon positive regulatory protein